MTVYLLYFIKKKKRVLTKKNHQSFEPVQPKGRGEHKQLPALLVQLQLVEGVIEIDDAVSITPCKLVS